jgi:hypothetical protein
VAQSLSVAASAHRLSKNAKTAAKQLWGPHKRAVTQNETNVVRATLGGGERLARVTLRKGRRVRKLQTFAEMETNGIGPRESCGAFASSLLRSHLFHVAAIRSKRHLHTPPSPSEVCQFKTSF